MELLQAAGQIATCVSAVVALVAVVVAVGAYRKQHTAQAFIHYTDRYREIMAQFPAWARGPRQFSEDALQESTESLRSACLNYLNLCSEEFFLNREKFLAGKVWNIWKDEIRRTLQSALFRREWPLLKSEFASFPAFTEFVTSVQREGAAHPGSSSSVSVAPSPIG
jgi:hypothetical protein